MAVVFTTPTTYAAGNGPDSVAVADVNGDGKSDLVIANYTGNSVSILLGNGDGTFTAPTTYATGTHPEAVSVADFNGDGKPDLVVANNGSGTISVLSGVGDGTFRTQATLATGSYPDAISVADLNGDGKADLIVGNYGDSTISVLTGDGNGAFQPRATYSAGAAWPLSIVAADFNGDGETDVVVTTIYGSHASAAVFQGDGTGALLPAHFSIGGLVPGIFYTANSGLTADFNGDGKPDLAYAYGPGVVSVLPGNGNGAALSAQYAVGTDPRSITTADFNGDGKADLVVANAGSNTLSILPGNGDGSFQTQSTVATGQSPSAVAVADFNGDGKPDLVVVSQGGNTFSILFNLGEPTFPFTEGADTVALSTPGRVWHAGAGDDSITGTTGADTIYGDSGSDTLDGGDGLTLTPAQKSIYRLYGAALGREPDAPGLDFWVGLMERGASLQSVADAFAGSPEFRSRYGSPDDTAFVTLLYHNVLKRAPDPAGLSGWLSDLHAGASQASVLAGFSDSPEYQGATELATEAWATTSLDGTSYGEIYRLYGAALGRQPDPGGFAGWDDSLASGQTLATITADFVNSAEFQSLYGALDDTRFVTLLYGAVLHRAPDPAGLAGWLDSLGSGASRASVVDGFSASAEYKSRTSAALTTWMRTQMPAWADTLAGGAGDNILFGGRGADTFLFDKATPGDDTILGFESWDILNFRGFGYASAPAAASHMTQSAADVVFSDQGETITFRNTALGVVTGAVMTLG